MKGDSENVGEMEDTPTETYQSLHHSDMKFSHFLNAKFYSKYRIDILFIIQTCLKSQKSVVRGRVPLDTRPGWLA